jgi:HK97 family phage portal protein
MSWKDFLNKGEPQEQKAYNVRDIDKSIPPIERMQKATQGRVEEGSIWAVTSSGKYLDRRLKVNGTDEDDLWGKYLGSSWLRACVDKIIKEVVKYQIVIKPVKEQDAETNQVKQHIEEITTFLDNPNEKIESFDDIRRKYLRDVLVYDAGAVEIVYKGQKPVEVYDLKGANIRLNLDKHGNFLDRDTGAYRLIDPYEHKPVANFGVKEVIYMIANPVAGSAYGLSNIETLWNDISNEIDAGLFNQKILRNSGLMSGVLSFAGMPEHFLKKQQRYWQAEMEKKGSKLLVTSNPDVKFIRVNENQRDMQFLEYQQWLLNKIMAVYGMQPMVLGVIDGTTGKLNSDEQREQFKSDAILPLLKLEAHRFTDVLIKQGFGYDDIELTHIEPENIDEEFELDRMKAACQFGIVTVNEARSFINLPPLEEGGEVLVSSQTVDKIRDVVEREEKKSEIADIRRRVQELLTEE